MRPLILISTLALTFAAGESTSFAQTAAPPAPKPAPAAEAAPAKPAPAPAATTAAPEPAADPAAEGAAAPTEPAAAAEPAPAPVAATTATTSTVTTSEDSYAGLPATSEPIPESKDSQLLMGLYWNMGMPIGSSAKWVNGFGVEGFALDVRYYPSGNFGFGGEIAWNTFSQKEVETLEFENITVTGTQVHELSATPFTFKGYYALRDKELAVIPYGSFGFGGSRALRRLDLGITRLVVESWHWTMAPELGIEIPAGNAGSALVAMRMNYLFKSPEGPEQIYLNFAVGFGFH